MKGIQTRRASRGLLVSWIVLAALAGGATGAAAQIAKSPPPTGAKTHTVVPGERYRAGGMKRLLLGHDYRGLWTMPVEVPVLNLDSVGGGLTPLGTGGFPLPGCRFRRAPTPAPGAGSPPRPGAAPPPRARS